MLQQAGQFFRAAAGFQGILNLAQIFPDRTHRRHGHLDKGRRLIDGVQVRSSPVVCLETAGICASGAASVFSPADPHRNRPGVSAQRPWLVDGNMDDVGINGRGHVFPPFRLLSRSPAKTAKQNGSWRENCNLCTIFSQGDQDRRPDRFKRLKKPGDSSWGGFGQKRAVLQGVSTGFRNPGGGAKAWIQAGGPEQTGSRFDEDPWQPDENIPFST